MMLTPYGNANWHIIQFIDQPHTSIVQYAGLIVQDGTSNDQSDKMNVHSATLNDQCAEMNVRCGTFIVQPATLNDQFRNSSFIFLIHRSNCQFNDQLATLNVHFAILNDQGGLSSTYF